MTRKEARRLLPCPAHMIPGHTRYSAPSGPKCQQAVGCDAARLGQSANIVKGVDCHIRWVGKGFIISFKRREDAKFSFKVDSFRRQ
ncbi:unnamed protein product [Protopolystoma xenopodis]|uniref:Uncharacterized protein n=1 Tax=Protopolystoma xenopodis TaxID=117903 RepID=A0A3S5AK14_9PLAT|nr:unnamed protein product [Protopolystoma xenopodis]